VWEMVIKKTSYNLDSELINTLKAIASLKGITQVELVEMYLKEGIERDKGIFNKFSE
jgi:hypothetical protein